MKKDVVKNAGEISKFLSSMYDNPVHANVYGEEFIISIRHKASNQSMVVNTTTTIMDAGNYINYNIMWEDDGRSSKWNSKKYGNLPGYCSTMFYDFKFNKSAGQLVVSNDTHEIIIQNK